jgi:acetyltransferase-like isoleucine patch superfamily enzyme
VHLGLPTSRLKKETDLVIGPNASVRTGTAIYQGTRIGKNLATGHNAVIREQNKIGDNFSIWNNSTIDYGCRIGNRVKVHCNCYVAQFTTLEDDVFLAPGVTIANDLYPGMKFSAKKMHGPHLEKGVQVGVNSTILPYVRIGKGSVIGSGSVVTKNVPAFSLVYGNPARVRGKINPNLWRKKIKTRS